VGFVVEKVALGRFPPSTSVSPANIIPQLLHIHLSPPHEVCDRSDQAAHYHNLCPKLGASLLTRHIGWKQKKKVKKKTKRIMPQDIFGLVRITFTINLNLWCIKHLPAVRICGFSLLRSSFSNDGFLSQ
jgi:hypothetical protein